MITCAKCNGKEFRWRSSPCNEDGWECCSCNNKPGEPSGFCPQLDRELVAVKIHDLLLALSGHLGGTEFIYVSNGSMGEVVVASVAAACRATSFYDQGYILTRILVALGEANGSDYWQRISKGILAGKDPRERCPCGRLANLFSNQHEPRCSGCHANQVEPF